MLVEVKVPYEMTIQRKEDLVLDPSAVIDDLTGEAALQDLLDTIRDNDWMDRDEEVALILTSAAALYAVHAGTIGQCIHTAIIWERG